MFFFLDVNDIGIGLEYLEIMCSLLLKIIICEVFVSCEDLINYIFFNILRWFKVFFYVVRIVGKFKSIVYILVYCMVFD